MKLALPTPIPAPGDPATLHAIAVRLVETTRPLFCMNIGGKFSGSMVARLIDMGIPVITSWNGRDVVPEDHSMSLGSTATTVENRGPPNCCW